MSERGVDSLQKRSGVDWVSALEGKPLSDKVKKLLKDIAEKNYNAQCGWYIKNLNNYYFAYDSNDDNIPDKVLVYSSLTKWRTEYVFPPIYDFWWYKDSNSVPQYLFASASGGQMFEFEYGYTDDGAPIETEVQLKDFDFWDPAQLKVFEWVDVTWYKQKWWELEISVLVDWESAWTAFVTDANITEQESSGIISVSSIGIESIWWVGEDDLPVYKFVVKIPFYARSERLTVNIQATWVQWILEKMRCSVNGEPEMMFTYDNII